MDNQPTRKPIFSKGFSIFLIILGVIFAFWSYVAGLGQILSPEGWNQTIGVPALELMALALILFIVGLIFLIINLKSPN